MHALPAGPLARESTAPAECLTLSYSISRVQSQKMYRRPPGFGLRLQNLCV